MAKARKIGLLTSAGAAVVLAVVLTALLANQVAAESEAIKRGDHVPEVLKLLAGIEIDKPRTHKNMIVFPIRWAGKQAPGDWEALDEAMAAEHLVITEKDQASVPEVHVENTGVKTVFLMNGEIVKGGKQTRVIKKDTVIEAKQKVTVPVFCVERRRWKGAKGFDHSLNFAPPNIRDAINRDADQSAVWEEVRRTNKAVGAESGTESLDEALDSEKVKEAHEEAHDALGEFSPPDTVGIAVADARTGRVVGVEIFGRRDLFEALQNKLIEGYTTDLVVAAGKWDEQDAKEVTKDDVKDFIALALKGSSKYEDTPGSGKGIDLVSGTLRGKGVALGEHAIHLSIQDVRPAPTPARPVVDDP
ncbi:MAG: ARPP-1 family domain-containing protein [Planctomycetota bacterium]|jgi:hypothetical protein